MRSITQTKVSWFLRSLHPKTDDTKKNGGANCYRRDSGVYCDVKQFAEGEGAYWTEPNLGGVCGQAEAVRFCGREVKSKRARQLSISFTHPISSTSIFNNGNQGTYIPYLHTHTIAALFLPSCN